jgi:hypothetical protein
MHGAGYGLPRTPIFRKVAFLCPRTVGGVKRRIYSPMGGGPGRRGARKVLRAFWSSAGWEKKARKGTAMPQEDLTFEQIGLRLYLAGTNSPIRSF